ncbi:CvfB family protein [Pedosphaera parvula]|uniref:GntR family transcriptional regulator n=1 Tax=Pedosphaera parvula (strain Ellin514) TaxID=320771 RepID=B9XLP6_PEDPL|nr:S1-like domain-containing RNA-binding protein [Pedosphaera parvula]EEF59294.1 conserved hypothetical protein [Pedosphaera parvula Ellin514]
MAVIGKRNILSIERSSGPGLYLNGGALGEILLPGRYIPRDIPPENKLDVFVYLDSEDRLVATTETPRAMVGEFAYLKVISVNSQVGAFLDWGLSKDLLLPFREQQTPVRPGQWVIVYVQLDPRNKRIFASTRLYRFLNRETPCYRENQPVSLLISGKTPLGFKAIVDNAHEGLLFHDKLSSPLTIGQKLNGFFRTIRPGGKIDLSLDASGYKRVNTVTEKIVDALERNGGRLAFDDDSSPETIREAFGISKKAFKQALGALYKSRRIRFQNPGIELLDNTTYSPSDATA